MPPLAMAQQYVAQGVAVIPIPPRQKGPIIDGWQKLRLAAEALPRYFPGEENIGGLNGEPSGWRIDIDLDHPLAVELADEFLPATAAVFGRTSKPRSHRQYIAVGAVTRQVRTKEHGMILELRSTGTRTVLPGSTHPSGELITWDDAGEPAEVDAAALLEAVERLGDEVCRRLGVTPKKRRLPPPPGKHGSDADAARLHIADEPPAIAGQGGHNQTFHVACELFRFGLADAAAAALMREYNNEKCLPPWTDAELEHKLTDARAIVLAAGQFGAYVRQPAADLPSVARQLKAPSDGRSGYIFPTFAAACEAAKQLGGELPVPAASDREVVLLAKNGQIIAEMAKRKDDPESIAGWVPRTKKWTRGVLELPKREDGLADAGELIRHVIAPGGGNIGWCIKIDGEWHEQPKDNCKSVLMHKFDVSASKATAMLGGDILAAYKLVDLPFQPEYPDPTKRLWNRFGAQLAYTPCPGPHPHYDMVLSHIGSSLDLGVKHNRWCQKRGITNGASYLLHWFASVFQRPFQLLPYLFFYGPQNFGKSSLHESVGGLMKTGCHRVDKAFTRRSSFNAELAGVILAVIEETSLATNLEGAYNLIKDLTTSPQISIERKGWDAYQQRNMAHCIQTGQFALHCPITDADDSRIVVGCTKEPPPEPISAPILRQYWHDEAPAFLHTLLNLKLPAPSAEDDRLYLPVISTTAKYEVIDGIRNLQQLPPAKRPAVVIAQQIAGEVRRLATENWLIKRTAAELLAKLTERIEHLPADPEQIGQALAHINWRGYTFKRDRSSASRLITVQPLVNDWGEDESDDEDACKDAEREASLLTF